MSETTIFSRRKRRRCISWQQMLLLYPTGSLACKCITEIGIGDFVTNSVGVTSKYSEKGRVYSCRHRNRFCGDKAYFFGPRVYARLVLHRSLLSWLAWAWGKSAGHRCTQTQCPTNNSPHLSIDLRVYSFGSNFFEFTNQLSHLYVRIKKSYSICKCNHLTLIVRVGD